jgi:hypothetical protein
MDVALLRSRALPYSLTMRRSYIVLLSILAGGGVSTYQAFKLPKSFFADISTIGSSPVLGIAKDKSREVKDK